MPFNFYCYRFVQAGVLLLLLVLLTGCKENDDKQPVNTTFNRTALLTHYADNLIRPAYTKLADEADKLASACSTFRNQPSASNLQSLKIQLINTALALQPVGAYDFGPALLPTGTLMQEVATFPVDTTQIKAYIQSNDTTLNNFNKATRGIYAIEYLVFVLPLNQSNTNALSYLTALSNHLSQLAKQVRNEWEGSYRRTFIEKNGTDAGSSVALLFNAHVFWFEVLKNFKFALPLGLRAGQTSPVPQLVEGYHSKGGVPLAKAHFNAIESIWLGQSHDGTNGLGFDDYLLSVPNGDTHVNNTKAQIAAVKSALNSLEGSDLANLVTQKTAQVTAVHTELSKLTRFIKSEQASLLGISITYSSGDGD